MEKSMKRAKQIIKQKEDGILMFLLIGVGYLLFCSALPALAAGVMSQWFPGSLNSYYAVLSFGAGLCFVLTLYRTCGESLEIGKNITLTGIGEAIFTGLLLFFAINFVVSPILGGIFKSSEINYTESVQSMFETPVPTFFQLVVIAPLMEELIFRGFLLKRALRWRSTWTSILLVAAFFGLLHLSIVQGLSAMAAGIFLCLLYVRKQSVALCILAHSLFNGLAFVMIILASGIL